MADIILCCGKIASEKTFFCTQLDKENNYFVFNTDEWMIHFYGQSPDCSVFHERLEKCTSHIYRLASKLLEKGIHVVLDFGFWTKNDRKACLDYFKKMNPKSQRFILYFPIDDTRQKENLYKREKNLPKDTFRFTEEKLAFFNNKFEEPKEKEMILWHEYKKN